MTTRLLESSSLLGTALLWASLGLQAPTAHGRDSAGEELEEIIVYGRAQQQLGAAAAASEGLVGFADIDLPPLLRVGELVEAVPGMVATQHSGTGKANQYFLRGFNLDHGTDFAVSVEGVPINLRTHGHGQGYLDLNFLIPELVATTRYRKGTYRARSGDFSAAGSADFAFHDRLSERTATVTVGSYDHYRALLAGSVDAGDGALTLAADLTRYEGPWKLDEDLDQLKLFGRWHGALGTGMLTVTALAYDSDWNATDQIPARAVDDGRLDRLGFVDPDLGGSTDRKALHLTWARPTWELGAYAVAYDFELYSNFTYLLDDPVDGDEFEQRDQRIQWGGHVEGRHQLAAGRLPLTVAWGLDFRSDEIDEVGLYRTRSRQRLETLRDDAVTERSLGAWSEAELMLTPDLRLLAGLRADRYDWDVRARRPENGGKGNDSLLQPKVGLAWRARESLELYANWGRGFHSNDVRGAEIQVEPGSGDPADPVDVLVEATGAELGARLEIGRDFNASLVLFDLDLDSELVFVGDAGGTEASGSSRRRGVEVNGFWQPLSWLALNGSWTRTDARFSDAPGDADEIPGAISDTAAFGANATFGPLSFSTRLRYLGDAPLIEDGSAESQDSLLLNAGVAWRRGPLAIRLDVFNLLDSSDDDISYFYPSRLPGEPAAGIEDKHFHPLEPRSARFSLSWHW